MASIKLNVNKTYYVNFRLLEATQPSTVRIGIGEKPGVSEPPPAPEPTCITKSVNQFWDFNYNINTAPSSVPETNPLGWSIIGRSGTLFSIRLPAANKWKELFGVAKIPDTIQFGFGGVIPGYKSPTKIYSFLSECKGNFDTPLPGNSKLICSGEFRSQGAKTVVLSTNASNYNNPSVPKWNQEKDFYFNFRLEGPVGDIGVDLDLFISADGTGLGSN